MNSLTKTPSPFKPPVTYPPKCRTCKHYCPNVRDGVCTRFKDAKGNDTPAQVAMETECLGNYFEPIKEATV